MSRARPISPTLLLGPHSYLLQRLRGKPPSRYWDTTELWDFGVKVDLPDAVARL